MGVQAENGRCRKPTEIQSMDCGEGVYGLNSARTCINSVVEHIVGTECTQSVYIVLNLTFAFCSPVYTYSLSDKFSLNLHTILWCYLTKPVLSNISTR